MTNQNEEASAPEVVEARKVWQEYLQKCCEVGQLDHSLDQLDSQRRELEKQIEVTKRAAKSAAHKHKELQQVELKKKQAEDKVLATTAPEAH